MNPSSSWVSFLFWAGVVGVFLWGAWLVGRGPVEGFTSSAPSAPDTVRCPNVLVQEGELFSLYNTALAEVPGVNPVQFHSLEDYTEFLQWQRRVGIHCPVLLLQQTQDAQGKDTYVVRPSVTDPQGGTPLTPSPSRPVFPLIDASRDHPPFNQNDYPGFDPSSFYQGRFTPLDALNAQRQALPVSGNPMDVNWGGQAYTAAQLNAGYYRGDEVLLPASNP
jgi:hypothetical protein